MSRASVSAFLPASAGPQAADLEVPSGRGFIALLEAFRATGGTAPAEIVARLLEEHQPGPATSLAQRIYTGQVFGFEWRASLWIPMFQFEANDLALNAAAQAVRAELPTVWSGWALAAWFAAANAQLEGHSPVDMLRSDLDAVLQVARAQETADEFVPYHARRAVGLGQHA
ncbi:hypothetical protein LNV08_09035 [Paucibacter sp. TC2R-5]|uniref:hypothetical protein n=1 Tax=Paucibacter sp. TC2R-5 TaxID=2893555 RepID=UPI0021E3F827|nr:hypothetical protein [Paucibacter sp. TC2R-5]MCV2359119.1 hypothetical protein [Paucibacter sp. TC2R-5]